MNQVCINGDFLSEDSYSLKSDNTSYRYGDGLFESIKIIHGKIPLKQLHFERLWNGMRLLNYQIPVTFTPEFLEKHMLDLCDRNQSLESGRIRLSVSRGHGSLFAANGPISFLIESWPYHFQKPDAKEKMIRLTYYPDGKKSCDILSNLKSADFLLYSMASQYAITQNCQDSLVLNQYGRIADATIANVFILKNDVWFTPILSDGCIAGVMRQYLLNNQKELQLQIQEKEIALEELEQVDEIILTNAVQGLRYVSEFQGKKYETVHGMQIEERLQAFLNQSE